MKNLLKRRLFPLFSLLLLTLLLLLVGNSLLANSSPGSIIISEIDAEIRITESIQHADTIDDIEIKAIINESQNNSPIKRNIRKII